jgi:hypothetical protein
VLLGRKRKVKGLTRQEALSALPVRNQALKAEPGPEGELTLTVPRREDWVGKLLASLFAVPKERKIVLDRVGADIWQLCDGQNTVQQIIARLSEQYKLNRKEAEVSLTAYLRQLGRRGLIGFAVPKSK